MFMVEQSQEYIFFLSKNVMNIAVLSMPTSNIHILLYAIVSNILFIENDRI